LRSGVVDYWRLYALDPVYEELLTLPSIYNIYQRAIREGRGGPGIEPHPAGPVLVHEMAQHAPGNTPGGQSWHRDGGSVNPSLRCTFTLSKCSSSLCVLEGRRTKEAAAQTSFPGTAAGRSRWPAPTRPPVTSTALS